MKRTIPFELFNEKQELCFTIPGIVALEKALGKSIQQIVHSQDAGFNFCLTALPICLKNLNPHLYVKKIEDYLSIEGRTIDDIAMPIIHAVAVSGALGKKVSDDVMTIYYPELYKKTAEDEAEKNG